jgi:hypothetical protein
LHCQNLGAFSARYAQTGWLTKTYPLFRLSFVNLASCTAGKGLLPRHTPTNLKLRYALLSVLGFLVIQMLVRDYIFPFTSDSPSYIGIAYQMLNQNRIATNMGLSERPLPDTSLHWPFGFPAAIAFLHSLEVPITLAPLLLSLLSASGTVGLLAYELCGLLSSKALLFALSWLILVFPFTLASSRACTEALFLFLSLCAFLCVSGIDANKKQFFRLILLGFSCALATYVRFTGAFLTFSCALALLFAKGVKRRSNLLAFLLSFLCIIAPLVLWRIKTGDGPRQQRLVPVATLLQASFIGIIRDFFVPALGIVLYPFVLGSLANRSSSLTKLKTHSLVCHLSYLVIGIGSLVITGLFISHDGLDMRTQTPFVPSLIIVATHIASKLNISKLLSFSPNLFLGIGILSAIFLFFSQFLRTQSLQPTMPLAMTEIHIISQSLPRTQEKPILTTNPMVAVERPDLYFRTPLKAPNSFRIPLPLFLEKNPEHRGSLMVYGRELEQTLSSMLKPIFCTRLLCVGSIPQ